MYEYIYIYILFTRNLPLDIAQYTWQRRMCKNEPTEKNTIKIVQEWTNR